MRIIIVQDEIEKSSLGKKLGGKWCRFTELPNVLKNNLTQEFNKWIKSFGLKELLVSEKDVDDTILIFQNHQNTLLKNSGSINPDSCQPLKELLKLLVWYFNKHFDPAGVIGEDRYCSDCKYLQVSTLEYCENPDCPSHKKWQEILGPSYEPAKREDLPWPYSEMMTPEEMDAFMEMVKKELNI